MFPDSYGYVMKDIAANGDSVLTERLDLSKGPDGTVHAVPVMGTFIVRNGKIARWTDYWVTSLYWDTSLPGTMTSSDHVSALVHAAY